MNGANATMLNYCFYCLDKKIKQRQICYIATMENEEKFSENPEEQLRIENELLKLKLQAELGAEFGNNADIPPEVEQEFLKQIMAFQEHQKDAPLVVFGEYVGGPELKPAAELKEADLEDAWDELEALLHEKHLHVNFGTEYPLAVKYEFVRVDLFPLEIMQPSEGHNWIFDYEEFHPNHALEIEESAVTFLNDFFANTITKEVTYLADTLIGSNGNIVPVEELVQKVQRFHDLFTAIKHFEFKVVETKVDEPQEADGVMMGFVEGRVKYTIETEDHQEEEIIGPFKCYFQHIGDWWDIFCFHIHGFVWET